MIYHSKKSSVVFNLLLESVTKYYCNKRKKKVFEAQNKPINFRIFDWFLIKSTFIIVISYLFNLINIFNGTPFYTFKVNNIEIGKYVTSTTLRNVKVNTSIILFFINFHKNLIMACFFYASALRIENKTSSIFINEPFYLYGIVVDFFLPKPNIDVYLKIYPYNLICINKSYDNLNSFIKNGFKDTRNSNINYKKAELFIKSMLNDPKKNIYYYQVDSAEYKFKVNLENKINLIVYVHSFTDVQMLYGFDGFKSVFDWLRFTIKRLNIHKEVNIFIKVHPNMYREKTASNIETMDLMIWDELKKTLPSNLQIIDTTISNNDLLKFFKRNNTVLISHHGNALVEGSYLGFKTISSYSSLFSDNYSFVNIWKNKDEYSDLLNKACNKMSKLINPDESLFQFICDCYLRKNGDFSDKEILTLISKYTNLKKEYLSQKIENYDIDKDIKKSIIDKISKSITSV